MCKVSKHTIQYNKIQHNSKPSVCQTTQEDRVFLAYGMNDTRVHGFPPIPGVATWHLKTNGL